MENKEILKNLSKIISEERIKQNEPMKNHTSFKIGGPAEFYIKIKSIEELQKILFKSVINCLRESALNNVNPITTKKVVLIIWNNWKLKHFVLIFNCLIKKSEIGFNNIPIKIKRK